MRLKIKKLRQKLKSTVALCLCASMLAPTIARGVVTDASYQMQNVLPTWSQRAESDPTVNKHGYKPTY